MESIARAIILKKELDSLRPLSADDEQRIMQKFRLDWNYHSNHLEGNTLTYGETKALLLFNITAQGKPLKDHIEITGHNEAIQTVLEVLKEERPLTEHFIREIHKLFLKEPYEVDAITPDGKPTKRTIQIGSYKSAPNHVKTPTGEIFRFATPEETTAKMHDLIEWYREEEKNKEMEPILLASEFHYRFIRIHPFDDGNGRTARILMNFILMKHGYPPVVIKTEEKENYFAALRQADAGILEAFVEYVAINLIQSLEVMIRGAKGESIEEDDDVDKEVALLKQQLLSEKQFASEIRSSNSIEFVYEDLVNRILTKFLQKSDLFNDFYVEVDFRLVLNDQANLNGPMDVIIERTRQRIDGSTKSARLVYKYFSFKDLRLDQFNYCSELIFSFEPIKYIVSNSDKTLILEKKYFELLSDNELSDLMKSEVKIHKAFIEQKIKEAKNKK